MTDKKKDKIFTFKEQLKLGDRGEELFMERYPRKLEIFPGKEYDFIVKSSREKLELKTDNFNIDKTENFFFERFSDVKRQTPGGPWRAEKDGVDIFVYYFIRHNIWFEFNNLPELIKDLNKITEKKSMVWVKNNGYVTGGYPIKRQLLEEHFTIWEFNPEDD